MIYMKTQDGKKLLVIEPRNIELLKEGNPLMTPDKEFMIAYSPDVEWTANRITEAIGDDRGLDTERLDQILVEGLKRTPIVRKSEDDQMKRVM